MTPAKHTEQLVKAFEALPGADRLGIAGALAPASMRAHTFYVRMQRERNLAVRANVLFGIADHVREAVLELARDAAKCARNRGEM